MGTKALISQEETHLISLLRIAATYPRRFTDTC